jgi:hypothetical protein
VYASKKDPATISNNVDRFVARLDDALFDRAKSLASSEVSCRQW